MSARRRCDSSPRVPSVNASLDHRNYLEGRGADREGRARMINDWARDRCPQLGSVCNPLERIYEPAQSSWAAAGGRAMKL